MFIHVERSDTHQLVFYHQECQFSDFLDCVLPTLTSITCDHTLTVPVSHYYCFFFLFLHHVDVIYQLFLLLRLYLRIQLH